jgi:hypothetical protein
VETQPILASKKRIFLAWYLDFILFMVFWSLLNHFLFSGSELPFWMGLFIFGLLEFVCIKFFGSIGMGFLSVDGSHQVDPDINKRENWLTILLGVLFILEGTKKLVRWIDLSVPHPIFGVFLDPNIQIIVNILTGLLFLVVGYFFLKLKPASIWLGLIIVLGTIVSCVLSWSLWDETVARLVMERRELQSLPVREGEIEFMQALMPEGFVVAAVLFGLGILISYKRFS